MNIMNAVPLNAMLLRAVVHVVDDDESVRDSLGRLLEFAGHQVRTHASAGDFLLTWPIETPACVIVDVRMPGPSGLDLQAALSQRHDAPPVVLMSGYGDIPMSVLAMKRAMRRGVRDRVVLRPEIPFTRSRKNYLPGARRIRKSCDLNE